MELPTKRIELIANICVARAAFVFLCILSSPCLYSQNRDVKPNRDEIQSQKLVLISDLKSLAIEIPRIDGPLARALADAEIADAVWTLDREWAKALLRDAYKFTYPTEDEHVKSPPRPVGAQPQPPTEVDRARNDIRSRIFSVAGRDKTFAD